VEGCVCIDTPANYFWNRNAGHLHRYTQSFGLKWKEAGPETLPTGTEIHNTELVTALLKGKFSFTHQEWDKLNVSDLSHNCHVKASGNRHFEPAFPRIEEWFPPGLKWEQISAVPKGGTEIYNSKLAVDLVE